ncbi:Hypothetical predicted protein [Cloeon dipterum]|uniref:C2H2-type domain-containing protein n=1 Tax=Cloeon dipterum TaxID=197152 RepID=A0A8S1DYT0_9INSE|nr:Hypothetical predicted protein [Cloeon dipterum]
MATFHAHMPLHTIKAKETAKFPCPKRDCKRRFFKREHVILHLSNDHVITKKSMIIKCPHCDEIHAYQEKFRTHMKKSHGVILPTLKQPDLEITCSLNGHLKCNFCPEKFTSKAFLKKHILVHLLGLEKFACPFACAGCGKNLRSYPKLTLHYKQMHRTEWPKFPYECELCSKSFANMNLYRCHFRVHSEKFCMCDACGVKFADKKRVENHIRNKHFPKILICEVCGVGHSTKESFRAHLTIHNTDTLLKCLLCDYTTHNMRNLRVHMKKHFRRKIRCKICRKAVYNLKGHTDSMHNGKRREYSCHLCNRKFNVRKTYEYHMGTHFGTNYHQCEVCGKEYNVQENLRIHRKNKHGIWPYECQTCKKGFPDSLKLKRHRATAHRNTD